MNDLTSSVGLMRRELRDVRSVVSRMDTQMRRMVGASTTERCLAVRAALCAVFAHTQRRSADDVARERFPADRSLERLMVLRAIVNPAHTGTATGPPN